VHDFATSPINPGASGLEFEAWESKNLNGFDISIAREQRA
jgi:hypothetical protein